MTVGLFVWDDNGALVLDTSTGMSRTLGTVTTTAGSAGSLTHAGLASGTPYVFTYPTAKPDFDASGTFPLASVSGTKLNWTAGTVSATIVYGVYAGTSAGAVGAGTVGFWAMNDNQATQIDSLYPNHALRSTGAISLGLSEIKTLTVTASYPLIAYRGTGLITVITQKPNGNGTWTIVVMGHNTVATAGTYYLFDVAAAGFPAYNETCGLQIYNPATGALTYDSAFKYMRIVGRGDTGLAAPAYYETQALSQDNLAVIIDPGLFSIKYDTTTSNGSSIYSNTTYYFYLGAAGVNGTTLSYGSIGAFGSSLNVSPAQPSVPGAYWLIDVSGF